MVEFSPDAYFQLDDGKYEGLIQSLLAEVQGQSSEPISEELAEARRRYFAVAVKKGTDLSALPENMANLTTTELTEAAAQLPDKEGIGWNGPNVSVSESDRKNFELAAAQRAPGSRWDDLFPDATNDVVLPFLGTAQSVDDKIATYIAQHNALAEEKLNEARAQDALAREHDPNARSRAGSSIDQRSIRRDPNDLSKLQTLNPNKEGTGWEQGPRLGKFLQDRFEWELFDIFQREADSPKTPSVDAENTEDIRTTLKDIANRDDHNADTLLDADKLKVVISRDPQKIGEMSTGQRWRSCMNIADGINRHFVPEDIKEGSLVAYVVHEDDVDARYPLMRQLIKPFRNEAGDTVLIPQKIYGGFGTNNSRTRDALEQTLHDFSAKQNAGKSGEFHMPSNLYADGQVQVVQLQSDWSPESTHEALRKYQAGSLQESFAEIRTYAELLANGRRGAHGEDPAINIKKRRNEIRRLLDAKNTETGLPRMFFRAMVKASIGSVPIPKVIYDSSLNDKALMAKGEAFQALMKGDVAQWQKRSGPLSITDKIQAASAVVASHEPGTNEYLLATDEVANSVNGISQPKERLDAGKQALTYAIEGSPFKEKVVGVIADSLLAFSEPEDRISHAAEIAGESPRGSALQVRAGDILIDNLGGLKTDIERFNAANGLLRHIENGTPLCDRTVDAATSLIPALQTPSDRVHAAEQMIYKTNEGSVSRDRLLKVINDNILDLSSADERIWKSENVLRNAVKGSELHEQAGSFVIDNMKELDSTDRRVDALHRLVQQTEKGSPLCERALGITLSMIPTLDSPYKQLNAATGAFPYAAQGSANQEFLGDIVINNIHALSPYENRVKALNKISEGLDKGSDLFERSMKSRLDIISELQTPKERIDETQQMLPRWGEETNPTIQNLACQNILNDLALDRNVGSMTSVERIHAAQSVERAANGDPQLRESAGNIILDNVPDLPNFKDQIDKAKDVLRDAEKNSSLSERAGNFMLDRISTLPTAEERVAAVRNDLYHMDKNSALVERASDMILKDVPQLPQAEARVAAAESILYKSGERAGQSILENLSGLPTAEARAEAAQRVLYNAEDGSSLKSLAAKSILDNVSGVSSVVGRVEKAKTVLLNVKDNPALVEQAQGIIIDGVPDLPTAEERVRTIERVKWDEIKNPLLEERANNLLITNIGEMEKPKDRAYAALESLTQIPDGSDLQKKAQAIAKENIPHLSEQDLQELRDNIRGAQEEPNLSPQEKSIIKFVESILPPEKTVQHAADEEKHKNEQAEPEKPPASTKEQSRLVAEEPTLIKEVGQHADVSPTIATPKLGALRTVEPAVHGAMAGLGVVGAVERMDGRLQQDLRGDNVQATAGVAAMAADTLNASGGVISTATHVAEKVVPTLAEGALGTASKIAGKAALPLAVAATGADIVAGVQSNDAERVAGAGGSLVGSVIGGVAAGATAGAVLGIETGPAAVITGVVGGVVGGIVGEKVAKEFLTDSVRKVMGPSGRKKDRDYSNLRNETLAAKAKAPETNSDTSASLDTHAGIPPIPASRPASRPNLGSMSPR